MSVDNTVKVLVIEDDALVALDLSATYGALGFRVVGTAATEEEAVASARRHQPDLLSVDIRLRQGTGTAAVSRIQAERPVPHLYVTGSPVEVLDRSAVVVIKPFTRRSLLDAVRRALGG